MERILSRDDRLSLEVAVARARGGLRELPIPGDLLDRKSIFHAAVEYGAVNCLRYLVKICNTTDDIHLPDLTGRTPLHYAVECGYVSQHHSHLQCLEILIQNKAYVNARDKYGDTALHNICQMSIAQPMKNPSCYLAFVDVLLMHPNIDLHARNNNDQKLNSYKSQLLEENYLLNEQPEADFQTLLYNAVVTTDDEILNKVSERMKEIKNVKNEFVGTKTVLFHLTKKMNALLKKALDAGMDPWIPNIDDGKIPLHAAVASGNVISVTRLLHRMNEVSSPYSTDWKSLNFSILKTAVCNAYNPGAVEEDHKIQHLECLKLCIKHMDGRIHPADAPQRYGDKIYTAMELAIRANLSEFVSCMSQYSKENRQFESGKLIFVSYSNTNI